MEDQVLEGHSVSRPHEETINSITSDLRIAAQLYSKTIEEAAISMRQADSQLQNAVLDANKNSLEKFAGQFDALTARLEKIALSTQQAPVDSNDR